jgi:hypothetical protein
MRREWRFPKLPKWTGSRVFLPTFVAARHLKPFDGQNISAITAAHTIPHAIHVMFG